MARARAAGVSRFVVPGVRSAGWGRLRELAAEHGWCFGVGTHPQCLTESQDIPLDLDGASAVGECGLDGPTPVAMDVQERVLAAHLALARDANLPVILHCWHAHDRMPALLKRFAPLRGVMHSYSGGVGLVETYVRLGLHLSFTAAITRVGARKPVDALRAVPLDRLLAETDAPDQGGPTRNEPARLPAIVAAMERLRGEPVAAQLDVNAQTLGW